MDENELIRRSQTGDAEAFGALIERHHRALFGTAHLIMRDRSRTEDVLQDALVRAWRGIGSFHVGNSFKSWLVRIVANTAKKQLARKRLDVALLEEVEHMEGHADPAVAVVQEEERRLMREALEALAPEHRDTLALRFYGGLTVPEIARALGCREGTVKSRLHRALDRLGDVLAQREREMAAEG